MPRPIVLLFIFVSFILLCCARMPSGYNDFYARHKLWPLSLIFGHTANPQVYMDGCFNSSKFYNFAIQPCDMFNKDLNITCAGALGVSDDDEAIILMFRGTINNDELVEENTFYNVTENFPGGGTVAKFWYNGFLIVWNAGLRDAFFAAKNKNPTYELWVTGFSMGGSIAGNAAAYISQMGYLKPAQIKLVTFGETRIGHPDFANRYPSLVPYAYRVTHNRDIVPHIIPVWGGYQHHQNEIWYPNYMLEGDIYVECDEPESKNCSDSVPQAQWTASDHWYFNNTGHCKKGTGE